MARLVDFDRRFSQHVEKWIAENRHRYQNMDQMEEEIPEVYLRWLNTPADWLEGRTPGEWFQQYNRPEELIDLIKSYQAQGISLPDPLLERITDLGDEAVGPLMELARDEGDRALATVALNLLVELGSARPMDLCLDIISREAEQNELTDVASELLAGLGGQVIEPILQRMEAASPAAQDAFLDVLCNFPGDDRIYNYAVSAFQRRYDKRALYASYLGKLGDERAIGPLREALELSDITYLDYIEMVNAIESLGGEVDADRNFAGDPYYESLRKMR